MSDSEKKPSMNYTMGDFRRNLNAKLEKAGLPLMKKPSKQRQTSESKEFQVTFIKKKK